MKIVLASMFRNSTSYLGRYAAQAKELHEALTARGHCLKYIFAEGDSYDDTWGQLQIYFRTYYMDLFKREHGGKHAWHSVDIPERWKALAWVCNGILERVTDDIDALVYVEADLGWESETMVKLLEQLDEEHPVISPMCHTSRGEFYDLWGHMKDGMGFGPFPPYHRSLGPGLTVVDSAGSCHAMLGKVARVARYDSSDHCRGLGRSIRAHGFSWWVDPTVKVIHY